MSEIQDFEFDESGDRIFETPVVHITFDDGEIVCRYDNTIVKKYGDPQFNHVEWLDEEERCVGVRVIPEALQQLEEMGFPTHFQPNIIHDDPNSYEWFVDMVMKDVAVDESSVPDWWCHE